MKNQIICGDAIEELKKLPENSVDAIITDPPYQLSSTRVYPKTTKINEISEQLKENVKENTAYGSIIKGFMGKEWDVLPTIKCWKECLRVLKPGGFLLSFGGTRTYHRLVCGIEDAGFEIRDTIMWLYGSGFPKSLNIGKQIDKKMKGDLARQKIIYFREKRNLTIKQLAEKIDLPDANKSLWDWEKDGHNPSEKSWKKIKEVLEVTDEEEKEFEREIIGNKKSGIGQAFGDGEWKSGKAEKVDITLPATPEAKQWEGWGTALKPACEPIVVARKPLSEKNVALNVLKWGTGGLNIDACRINYVGKTDPRTFGGSWKSNKMAKNVYEGGYEGTNQEVSQQGRFPSNIILDEQAGKMLDEQSGETGAFAPVKSGQKEWGGEIYGKFKTSGDDGRTFRGDKGGASRFFYCAKASRSERNFGLDDKQPIRYKDGKPVRWNKAGVWTNDTTPAKNNHPTVKPIKLMEYLIKLVSREGATILDPFIGSGTTAIACLKLNRKYIGIEKEEEYVKIAEARIKPFLEQTKL